MTRLAAFLLLCLALAACGKSDAEKYQEDFPPIDRGLVALGSDVEEGLRQAEDATLASRFAGYARRLGDLRERLDELEPPGSVSEEHKALLAAMASTRGALDAIATAARRSDAPAAKAAATRLVKSGAELEAARAALAREARAL